MKAYLVGYRSYTGGKIKISSSIAKVPDDYDLLADSQQDFKIMHKAGAEQSNPWEAMHEGVSLRDENARIISISYLGELV